MAGTWSLIKLILRRDRVKLPLWILVLVGLLILMVPLLQDVYGDESSLGILYQTLGVNPSARFLTGPMDSPTIGAFMVIETFLWWAMALAFMNILLIVRHTRHNEEIGAQELILSGSVHRSSPLTAVLLVALIVNAVVAVMIVLGFMAIDAPWSADQSLIYGLAMGLLGLVFAAMTAIVVQLVESGRLASGIMAGLVGVAFVVRGIGDFMGTINDDGVLEPTWVSQLSPFGWMQATRPLTNPEWWPLMIPTVFVAAVVPLAFLMLTKRDVGAGVLPSRKGKDRAGSFLKTPLGLTLKLHKNIFIGWLVGTLSLAIIIGVLVPEMSDVYSSSEAMRAMMESLGGAGETIPSFLSAMLSIAMLMVTAYTVQATAKLRSEEYNGYLENLLATRLSRVRWMGLHVAAVVLGSAVMLAASGAAIAISSNLASDYSLDVWRYTLAGLSYLPIQMAFVGFYVLLFGLMPRIAGAVVWMYFGFVAFMSWIGPMLKVEDWVMNMSITTHMASPPLEQVNIAAGATLVLAALVMSIVGAGLWRSRNIIKS